MRDASPGIAIRIDVLSLPDDLASCSAEIAGALQRELVRLVSEGVGVQATARPAESLMCDVALAQHMSGRDVGISIARAVYEGIQR